MKSNGKFNLYSCDHLVNPHEELKLELCRSGDNESVAKHKV